MIETGALPLIHSMAAFALGGKFRRHVVRRLRLLIVAQVATHALRAQPDEHACGGAAMARIAGDGRMSAKQWESVQVVLDGIYSNPPPANRMTILAGGSELAAMDVGVTIRALLTDVAEDLAGMALGAGYILVQGSQREFRLGVMVELRFRANRLPAHAGVAALAGQVKRSVGINSSVGRRWLRAHQSGDSGQHHRQ